MSTKDLLEAALVLQTLMNLSVLGVAGVRRILGVFPQLGWLVTAGAISSAADVLLLFHHRALKLDAEQAYATFFYVTWALSTCSLVLRVAAVYGIFAEAIRPLKGLHQAGKVVFRWVAVVSALVAFALLAGPGVFSSVQALTSILSRLQQGVSVLTLCLLVFVCFTVRPLGLTFRNHLFGVSLGLGIAASVELVQAAWLVTKGAYSVYSPIYVFTSLGMCVSLAVWCGYFAAPEPKRRMILLPTTSPFFFWNRISEILGDSPGQVAVAGFTPDMLAPAEIEMLTAIPTDEVPAPVREVTAARSSGGFFRPERLDSRHPSLAV